MGEKVQLGDHAWADRLLPWFVNNTLDEAERDRVRRHVDGCDACRASVSLLSTVQDSVRHATATPIVPTPQTRRLLENIDTLDRTGRRTRALTAVAFAASVAAVLVVTLLLPGREQAVTEPARYETTTSPVQRVSMDYVLEVQFEPGIPLAAQQQVLNRLEVKEINHGGSGGVYRVTVSLPASSLAELEQYARDLAASGEIRSVHPVAVQLPVKPAQ